MILLALALLTATPRTLPFVLATARAGDTIRLASGTYRNIVIARTYPAAITIDATGANVRGLLITGGGVLWKSGTLAAPAGRDGFAMLGYGALVTGSNVTFSGVTITNARKGLVLDRASGVSVLDSLFVRLREDGVIASRTTRLAILRNRFLQVMPNPTSCATASGIVYELSRVVCEARGGVWTDGNHPDAVQMRNGVADAVIADNVVNGKTHGMTQMDTVGDAPLERVRIERNDVAANIHHITLGDCRSCVIRDNVVRRWRKDSFRAVIRPGAARRCENRSQDEAYDGGCQGSGSITTGS